MKMAPSPGQGSWSGTSPALSQPLWGGRGTRLRGEQQSPPVMLSIPPPFSLPCTPAIFLEENGSVCTLLLLSISIQHP